MKAEILERMLTHIQAKRPIVLATDLATGEQRLLGGGDGEDESERTDVLQALRVDSCIVTDSERPSQVFYQPFNPPLRMILIGAVHIAQPLSAMATLTGYEVTIVDPRESFAAADRFPGVELNLEWPDSALESMSLDQRCAVVTLTHDPKLDDPALQVALRRETFFIGCLGSKKTHASRLRRLGNAGFAASDLERIKGPVGLPIGSRSPAEIAVSVMAQVTETLRHPPKRGLSPFAAG